MSTFYRVRITGGQIRPEPNGETAESAWTPIPDVAGLQFRRDLVCRSGTNAEISSAEASGKGDCIRPVQTVLVAICTRGQFSCET